MLCGLLVKILIQGVTMAYIKDYFGLTLWRNKMIWFLQNIVIK
jgi:hypothetical protein